MTRTSGVDRFLDASMSAQRNEKKGNERRVSTRMFKEQQVVEVKEVQ